MGCRAAAVLATVVVTAGALLVACGGDDQPAAGGAAEPVEGGEFSLSAAYPHYYDEANGLRVILGTPDLAVGRHRVGFVLSDESGLVRLPVTRVSSFFAQTSGGEREGPVESGLGALLRVSVRHTRDVHTRSGVRSPGTWELEVSVPRPDGSVVTTAFAFPVAERALAPVVGERAPASASRSAADVQSLHELTTGRDPDPALYRVSLAEAVGGGTPVVVVFASPAFCTNELCGPQVEVLSELAAAYGERARFIHVDLYENPHEIRGDLDRAVRTPILAEWGLETDEWTFVVDGDGVVAARFEAFVTRDELERALMAVLGGDDPTSRRR